MLLTTLTRTKKKSQQLLILIGFLLGMSPVMALEIITIEKKENYHMLKTRAENIQFPLNREDKDLIEAMKKKIIRIGRGWFGSTTSQFRQTNYRSLHP